MAADNEASEVLIVSNATNDDGDDDFNNGGYETVVTEEGGTIDLLEVIDESTLAPTSVAFQESTLSPSQSQTLATPSIATAITTSIDSTSLNATGAPTPNPTVLPSVSATAAETPESTATETSEATASPTNPCPDHDLAVSSSCGSEGTDGVLSTASFCFASKRDGDWYWIRNREDTATPAYDSWDYTEESEGNLPLPNLAKGDYVISLVRDSMQPYEEIVSHEFTVPECS